MFSLDDLKAEAEQIQSKLKVKFKNLNLLFTAFVHSSYFNENRNLAKEHNERLEFLGDAVLGLLISDFLYKKFPSFSEGKLSLIRSSLVCAPVCMQLVQKLNLDGFVLLGKGENLLERGRETILANLFEALIGAIYLDGGFQKAYNFLFDNFSEDILKIIETPLENFKAELQSYTQKHLAKTPEYRILEESGPDHSKKFMIGVFLEGIQLATGDGSNKKEAEQKAAKHALEELKKK